MSCEQCKYCRFPRSSNDNGGSCKCKIAKYKTIDVYVSGGETPLWCPLLKKEEKEGKDGALLVDTDPVLNKPMRLCTKLGNQFDGEPDTPIEFTRYKDDKIAVDRRMTWR